MGSIAVLAALAARLNRESRPKSGAALPSLYFFTDPVRTPNPVLIAEHLPRGAAVVFRHFGKPDRFAVAAALAHVCRARRLKLLISADPDLARRVSAAGVYWPERRAPSRRPGDGGLHIAGAHSRRALARAAAAGFDACVLAPVFESRSASSNEPLGAIRAGQLARGADLPTIALGGINASNAKPLVGRGFAGLAAVDAFRVD